MLLFTGIFEARKVQGKKLVVDISQKATILNETLESLFNHTAENVTSNLTKIANVEKSLFFLFFYKLTL